MKKTICILLEIASPRKKKAIPATYPQCCRNPFSFTAVEYFTTEIYTIHPFSPIRHCFKCFPFMSSATLSILIHISRHSCAGISLVQCFANFSKSPGQRVETESWPTLKVSHSVGLGGIPKFAFPTNSLEMLGTQFRSTALGERPWGREDYWVKGHVHL